MGLFFPNHCQFCFQNWWERLAFKGTEPSFPFLCLFLSPFGAVRDATLLFLVFHTSVFDVLLYKQLGKRLPCTKRVSVRGNAIASRNSQWSQMDPHPQLAKRFPADPAGIPISPNPPDFLQKNLLLLLHRQGECSSPRFPLQRCSHTSLASPLAPYFGAVSLHLVFLQN